MLIVKMSQSQVSLFHSKQTYLPTIHELGGVCSRMLKPFPHLSRTNSQGRKE